MKAERGYPRYTVTPKAEAAILRGHPWVYGEEVLDIQGETANGASWTSSAGRAGT